MNKKDILVLLLIVLFFSSIICIIRVESQKSFISQFRKYYNHNGFLGYTYKNLPHRICKEVENDRIIVLLNGYADNQIVVKLPE